MPEILRIIQFCYEGDTISESAMGTLNQTFARIFIQGKDNAHLLSLIDRIQKTLKIYDESGREMLLPGYDCAKANVLMPKYSFQISGVYHADQAN